MPAPLHARHFANHHPAAVQFEDAPRDAARLMERERRSDILVLDGRSVVGRLSIHAALRAESTLFGEFAFGLAEPAAVVHEDATLAHTFLVAARHPGQSIAVVDDDELLVGELGPKELALATYALFEEPPNSQRAA